MHNQKILDNIEPFNDVLYQRNCFLHSLFPVVHHFERTILPFLLNDIYTYEYDSSRPVASFYLRYNCKKPYRDLLQEMGINETAFGAVQEDITECIKRSINLDMPAIIMCDCFYLPLRVENYQKQHARHFILAYGYDDADMVFNIIDNCSSEGYIYKKHTLEYPNMSNAYDSLLKHCDIDGSLMTYYNYSANSKDQHISNEDIHKKHIEAFIQEMLNNKDRIYNSLENIKLFTKNISECLKDVSLLKQKGEDIIESTNIIISNRTVDKYRLFKVFENYKPACEALETIIGNWCYLRAGLMRSIKRCDLKPETVAFSVSKLTEIWELENAYHDSFYKLLEEWRCRL